MFIKLSPAVNKHFIYSKHFLFWLGLPKPISVIPAIPTALPTGQPS